MFIQPSSRPNGHKHHGGGAWMQLYKKLEEGKAPEEDNITAEVIQFGEDCTAKM